MKITTLLGSPRLGGNTARVLGALEPLLSRDHEVERVNVIERKVGGCLGCESCKAVKDAPGCVQEDEGNAVLEGLLGADAVVYATPLYCWGFTAQMKALVDRHYCLVKDYGTPDYRSLFEGKKTVLVVTCAGPEEGNADLVQSAFDRMNDYLKSRVIGKFIVPFCTTPDRMDSKAKETAEKIVRVLQP